MTDPKKLKKYGNIFMATGIGTWLLAVWVASEPSTTFRAFVFLGWGTALVGVVVHVVAFLRER